MMIYVVLSIIIAISYAIIQGSFSVIWNRLENYKEEVSAPIQSKLAILVPVRNEAKSIERCIKSLLAQDYPHEFLEIWLLDNHSNDQTVEIASQLADDRLNVVALADHLDEDRTFKKEALTYGINLTSSEWILTTDGDCEASPQWASTMVRYALEQQLDVVLGSVKIPAKKSFIERYQALDTAGLMAITAAGLKSNLLISGNGANFLFRKSVFATVGGYGNNQQHRSGDDLFLLQNFHQQLPRKVGFVKSTNAMVLTQAEPSLRSFLAQRLRWASKSKYLPHRSTRNIPVLVFLNSLVLLVHLLLIPLFGQGMIILFLVHFSLKAAADVYLLHRATSFFGLTFAMKDWCLSTLFNPLYIVSVGMATLLGKKATWKNRRL